MKNDRIQLPRPDQMPYIRMIGNKQSNLTLYTPQFRAWLKYIQRERIRTTNKINEI